MKKFYIRVGLIILIHIIWGLLVVMCALIAPSFDETMDAWSFFLTEPFFLFIVYPIIVYAIILLMLRIKPVCTQKQNKILLVISVICTAIAMGGHLFSYIELSIEKGFSIFLYDDYWLGILF